MAEEQIVFRTEEEEEAILDQNGLLHKKYKGDDPPEVTTIPLQNFAELEHEFGDCFTTVEYKDAEGDQVSLNIHFADNDEAEHFLSETSKKLGDAYTDETAQMSKLSAASMPFICCGIALVAGGFFSGVMYFLSTYTPERTRIVPLWLGLLYRTAQGIGYLPFVALTGLLIIACLIWAIRRSATPPTHRVIKLRV